ncbi:MAG: hypothetical protein DRO12_01755 [Thermoprotei archaeon]|nr:MAG: hypothetical protein DRO12_01755 [Thermoprotei archaeon]
MERVSAEIKELRYSIVDISQDLPRGVEGFVIAPVVIDDINEHVVNFAAKVLSLLVNGGYKKILFKDKERLRWLFRLLTEYMKQLTIHIASEIKLLDSDFVVLVILKGRKLNAISAIFKSDVIDFESDEENKGTVVIITDTKLGANDIERVLAKIQEVVDHYASRLGFYVPSITAVEDIRVLLTAIEESDIIKIRIREDYGKPVTIRIPVQRPAWSLDDLPQKLREEFELLVIDPIKSKAMYAPRGMLIVGPPGVGKSVTAEALAQALSRKLVRLMPSSYRSMWYGMTEKTLFKIFRMLKRRDDIIIVVDDADFLVQRMQAIHEAYIAEVNVWLNILQDQSRPFTVMTTNVPDIIDRALIRPGRLDVVVVMGFPDKEMRKQIATRAIKRYKVNASSKMVDEIVRITRWFNAAEIDALIRMAASKGRGCITSESLEWARKKFRINESERRFAQENLQWYGDRVPGLVVSYVPKEYEI